MNKSQILITVSMLLGVAFIFIFLCVSNQATDRIKIDNGQVNIDTQALSNRLYIMDGDWTSTCTESIRHYTLTLKSDNLDGYCIYIANAKNYQLLINGESISAIGSSDPYIICDLSKYLTPDNQYTIEVILSLSPAIYPDPFLCVYFGRLSYTLSISHVGTIQRLFVVGVSFGALLYSLSLYLQKRSEKYLLLLAILCFSTCGRTTLYAFPELGRNPLISILLSGEIPVPFFSATENTNLNLLFLQLLVTYLCCRLFEEFIPSKIGKHHYFTYMALLSLLVLPLTGNNRLFYLSLQVLRFTTFFLEGFIIIRGAKHKNGSLILAAAWCFTVAFRSFQIGSELDFLPHGSIDILLKLSGVIVTFYPIAFMILINGKFSKKYAQADLLTEELKKINMDLEELVQMRTQELKESYTKLKQVQKRKNELVTNMVHNFKSPLFALSGYTDMIDAEIDNDPRTAHKHLLIINQNIDFLGKMVDDLFLSLRLEENHVKFNQSVFSLSQMLIKVFQVYKAKAYANQIQLHFFINGTKQAWNEENGESNIMRQDICIKADEFYLQQAVQNIVDNALGHVSTGGRINICLSSFDHKVSIAIADNGTGIPADILPYIFNQYFSKRSDKRSSGLGLTIAQVIVTSHGGTISVESEEGKGSCFTITLHEDLMVPNKLTLY